MGKRDADHRPVRRRRFDGELKRINHLPGFEDDVSINPIALSRRIGVFQHGNMEAQIDANFAIDQFLELSNRR